MCLCLYLKLRRYSLSAVIAGVQEAVRGPKIDQRLDGNRLLTRDEKVDKKGKMAGGRKRERGGKGKSAAQPGSYWLGWEFFDTAAAAAAAAAAAVAAAAAAAA